MKQQQLLLEEFSPYRNRKQVLEYIAAGNFSSAAESIEKLTYSKAALREDFCLLKALNFWRFRTKTISSYKPGNERAEIVKEMLEEFYVFIARYHIDLQEYLAVFQYAVEERIFENLLLQLKEFGYSDIELVFKVARSAIAISDADYAIKLLEDVYKINTKDAEVRLMLASCLSAKAVDVGTISFVNNTLVAANVGISANKGDSKTDSSDYFNKSMHHYAHAFLGIKEFPLEKYPSAIFFQLAADMRCDGFSESEISCWLPCYAIKNNLFQNVVFYEERSVLESYESVVAKHKMLKKKSWMHHELLPAFAYHALFFIAAVKQSDLHFDTEEERNFFKQAMEEVEKSLNIECQWLVEMWN